MDSHCSRMRQDTTIPVRKNTKYDLQRRKPEGVTWNRFIRELVDGDDR